MERKRFIIRFAAMLPVGFVLIVLPSVQTHVIQPFTQWLGAASAVLLGIVGHEVSRVGTVIASSTFAVDVRNGCNGVEAAVILIAAILATPARWKKKLIGVFGGLVVLQAVNVVRISSLYLLGYYDRDLFELFHSAVWQVLIILVAFGIFVFWSVKIASRRDFAAAS
ncbi:MAG TPA: exosortase H [Thermoanaerobaculia bacterium]|nr:exosortase H [Thermoanaerobaculia bacterium]